MEFYYVNSVTVTHEENVTKVRRKVPKVEFVRKSFALTAVSEFRRTSFAIFFFILDILILKIDKYLLDGENVARIWNFSRLSIESLHVSGSDFIAIRKIHDSEKAFFLPNSCLPSDQIFISFYLLENNLVRLWYLQTLMSHVNKSFVKDWAD